MVATDDQDPQVILIVEEADLVSDFQQQFTSQGITVKFAADPGAARQAVALQRPRLVVLPVKGACLALLQAWAEGEPPADAVVGVVEWPSDNTVVPNSVTRTARRGRPQEIVSLAELLLRSGPAAVKPPAAVVAKPPAPAVAKPPAALTPTPPAALTPPPAALTPTSPAALTPTPPAALTPPPSAAIMPSAPEADAPPAPEADAPPATDVEKKPEGAAALGGGDKESIWNKPGGILKNLKPKEPLDEEVAEDSEEDFDLDPSRVSDIRSLGVAVRMAKAAQADSGPLPSAGPGLKLSHSGEDEDEDPYTKPAGITDAMSLLPQARAAETEEQTIARLAAERRSADALKARPTVKDPTAPKVIFEPEPVAHKSRKGLIIGIVVVVVLVLGGVAAYLLLLRPKPKAGKAKKAQVAKADKPARTKRGVHEDHFSGTIAQLPKAVTALDVDASDEFLNRSVPELDPYMELALRRLSRNKRRKTLMDRGTKLLGWERYPEARRFLKRAVELKDGPKARAGLSRAYEGLGRLWAAIVHMRQAIKRDRKNAEYHKRLGLLYLKEDKKKKGCKILKRAARLDKSNKAVLKKRCGKGKRRRRRRRRRRR